MKLKLTSLALISILSLGVAACGGGSSSPTPPDAGGGNGDGSGNDNGGGDNGGGDDSSGPGPSPGTSIIEPSNDYQDAEVSTTSLQGLWVLETTITSTFTGIADRPEKSGTTILSGNELVRIYPSGETLTAVTCDTPDDESVFTQESHDFTVEENGTFSYDNESGTILSNRLLELSNETLELPGSGDDGLLSIKIESREYAYKVNDNPDAEIGKVTIENETTMLTCLQNRWVVNNFPESPTENNILVGLASGDASDIAAGFLWTEDFTTGEVSGILSYEPQDRDWYSVIHPDFNMPQQPYISYKGNATFDTYIGGMIDVDLEIDYLKNFAE